MTEKKLLYHITDFSNMESILQQGGLLANNLVREKGIEYKNVAHTNIQDRRLNKTVPLSPNGNLHDYVPFYFAPRSPMLYAILKGRVKGYEEGQGKIIYLVSRIDLIRDAELEFVYTDGHAIMDYSDFYKDFKDLDKIDWKLMEETYWQETPEDPNRKTRRQAEFLVHKNVQLEQILGFAVKSEKMKQRVEEIIHNYNCLKPVAVRRHWYF